ncbi:flavoprotein [Salinispora oceanensis]|uniref:flavoprotein n=1 Tax=Salinispora oceanensis TaxID=1050199 RepID=UPI00037AAB12|nr:flavoprotein [Salinispora oceanensis]
MIGGHLQIVVCGAGPAANAAQLVKAAQGRSWTATVTATPSAMNFIESQPLESLTGHPVRSTYQSSPGTRRSLPATDALVIAPATYNSINKIALGLADNYAMTSVAELIGRQVPTIVVPFVNAALAARAPFRHAVASLRDEGVHVLLGPDDQWEPHPPGSGNERQRAFPWTTAFTTAVRLAHEPRPPATGHL